MAIHGKSGLFNCNMEVVFLGHFHFQVEVNHLEVMKSMCAILGQFCAALVGQLQKEEMDSKGYKVKGLLLCLEKITSTVQRSVRFK